MGNAGLRRVEVRGSGGVLELRGGFPNQVNNSLAFPSIFRGTLDVRATSITDGMALAAARELAQAARDRGISPEGIVPAMTEGEVYPRVAAAVGEQARTEAWPRSRELARN